MWIPIFHLAARSKSTLDHQLKVFYLKCSQFLSYSFKSHAIAFIYILKATVFDLLKSVLFPSLDVFVNNTNLIEVQPSGKINRGSKPINGCEIKICIQVLAHRLLLI